MLWPRVQAQQQQQGAQWRSLWEWGTYNDCAGGGVPMEHSIHTCSTERSLPCMAPQPTTGGASACPRRPNLAEIHDTACTSHPVAPITAAARVNEEMCGGAPGGPGSGRRCGVDSPACASREVISSSQNVASA